MTETTDTDDLLLPRRRFLTWQMALIVTFACPDRWKPGEGPAHSLPLLEHFFRRELPVAIRLGRKYLEATPSEMYVERIRDSILGGARGEGSRDIRDLTARVRASREADFRDGDLVAIDGWLLARTEARLCALAALSVNS